MKKTLFTIILGLFSIALFAQNSVSDVYKANNKFMIGFHNDSLTYKAMQVDSMSMVKFNELVEYVNQLRLENEVITNFFIQYVHERAGQNVKVPRLIIYYNDNNDYIVVSNNDLTSTEKEKIELIQTESKNIIND
jgi:radical SAM superfamily enzyme YgiQ (UPF0313 family)